MEKRFNFAGTGGELLVKLIVGYFLVLITLGIYTPWFMVKLLGYTYSKTTYGPTQRGDVQFEFSGTGGELFVKGLVGYLLTIITLGIYGPWFIVSLAKFHTDNSTGRAQDGTVYRLQLNATGGELFLQFLLGGILVALTIGLYMPWFICKITKLMAQRTQVLENNAEAGGLDFVGNGGDLFGTLIGGYLLTMITLGIYGAWFQVNLLRFYAQNTRATVHGVPWTGDFSGTGGQLLGKLIVGYLLSMITIGIYSFWFMADLLRWTMQNSVVRPAQQMQQAYPPQPGYPQQQGYPPQQGYPQQGQPQQGYPPQGYGGGQQGGY